MEREGPSQERGEGTHLLSDHPTHSSQPLGAGLVPAQRGRRAVPGLPGKRLRAGGLPGICICDSGLEVTEGWTLEMVGGVCVGLAQVRKG